MKLDDARMAEEILREHAQVALASVMELKQPLLEFAADLYAALGRRGKLIVFGNGGSAADAQHFAGELLGHFSTDREPLPAVALSTDSSVMTAIANDFAYAEVFARQVRGLARPEDLVVGISTSGRTENVLLGLRAARERGARTWALTGANGGSVADAADHAIRVPSTSTPRIQEMHITLIHAVCGLLDSWIQDDHQR
jgi:D-sedoheptulose 7-phosphate isomerase